MLCTWCVQYSKNWKIVICIRYLGMLWYVYCNTPFADLFMYTIYSRAVCYGVLYCCEVGCYNNYLYVSLRLVNVLI